MRLLLCILKGINEENAIDYRQLCLLPSSGLWASPHLPACYLKLVRDLEKLPLCFSVALVPLQGVVPPPLPSLSRAAQDHRKNNETAHTPVH